MDLAIIVTTRSGENFYTTITSEALSEEIPKQINNMIKDVVVENIIRVRFRCDSCTYTMERIIVSCCKGIQLVYPDIRIDVDTTQ